MIATHMDTLPNDIEALHALVRQLLAENAALKTKIAELEARLKTDSRNSHKPPSSDGLRKRPAFPSSRGRKKGGQPGHRGKTLKMVALPDTTVVCKPEVCSCGAWKRKNLSGDRLSQLPEALRRTPSFTLKSMF